MQTLFLLRLRSVGLGLAREQGSVRLSAQRFFFSTHTCAICPILGFVIVFADRSVRFCPSSRPAADCMAWFDHCHSSDSGEASGTWKDLRQRTKGHLLLDVTPPVSGIYEVLECFCPASTRTRVCVASDTRVSEQEYVDVVQTAFPKPRWGEEIVFRGPDQRRMFSLR